jgi:hypothetical protein
MNRKIRRMPFASSSLTLNQQMKEMSIIPSSFSVHPKVGGRPSLSGFVHRAQTDRMGLGSYPAELAVIQSAEVAVWKNRDSY